MTTGETHPFRALREAAGLSIREMERRTGINRGRLSMIERGITPTEDEARRFIQALDIQFGPQASGGAA